MSALSLDSEPQENERAKIAYPLKYVASRSTAQLAFKGARNPHLNAAKA